MAIDYSNKILEDFINKNLPNNLVLITNNPAKYVSSKFLNNLNQTKIVINTNRMNDVQTMNLNHDNYVLIENNLTGLSSILHRLNQSRTFNTRGRFLIVYRQPQNEQQIKTTMAMTFSYHVYNVVVYWSELITWYPYTTANQCGKIVKRLRIAGERPYENKIPDTLPTNCQFNVTWTPLTIAVKNPFDEHDPGFLVPYVNSVANCTKAKLVFSNENIDFQNIYIQTGNNDALLHDMATRHIDMVLMVTGDHAIVGNLDRSFPLWLTNTVFFMPPRKQLSSATNSYTFLSINTWILVGIVFLTMTILWKKITGTTLTESGLEMIRISIQQPTPPPGGGLPKYFWIIGVFYCTTITNVYISGLSSVMTKPGYEPNIDNLIQLADSHLSVRFSNDNTQYLEKRGEYVFQKLASRNLDFGNIDSYVAMETFVKSSNHAILLNNEFLFYFKNYRNVRMMNKDKVIIMNTRFTKRQTIFNFRLLERYTPCI